MYRKTKKILTNVIASILLLVSLAPAAALSQESLFELAETESLIYTQIQSSEFAEIERPIIFTARPQFDTETYEEVKYNWDFGDGNFDEGKEVAHSFNETGTFTVQLTVTADENEFKTSTEIFVALKAALLITDRDDKIEKVNSFIGSAQDSNIYITQIESFASQSDFLSEEVLARKIQQKEELINKFETIFIWTKGGAGLNALIRHQQTSEAEELFTNTSIVLILEDLENLRRVNRQFNQLQPKEIIAIEESARFQFLDTPDLSQFKAELNRSGQEFKIITEERIKLNPFNILSFFMDFLVEQGIPDNTLVLILLLPVIATVIAFMKQVIGITTLGIYTPTIITLTFLVLGLKFGIIILFFIIAMGTIAHKLLKPLRLLYIPKMALILTSVAIIIFLLLTLTVYMDLFDIEFISLAIFPVLIMGTLTEKFVSLRSEKGLPVSLIIMIETFFVSLIAYFVTGGTIDLYLTEIQWTYIRDLVLNIPEIIILFIIINLYLGRWTGLRLTEYFQFRDVFKNIEE